MQFSIKFSTLAVAAALAARAVNAGPAVVPTYLLTDEQFNHWLNTTDANITFVGSSREEFSKRQSTSVTYCNKRTDDVCGGTCNVYTGGPTCIDAPGTACISATGNVGFCDRAGCGHSCNQFSSCGTKLDDGFCATPGTQSINVGN
ncbi:uncharacterized protein STEHIDRAFT_131718 [Stereum hirsutum FP-91666 SS1]|uniref:uncharacterized protein n=1 Tax=Stereum hirsutum (strain FP-91666) TaxID=721885 RepID=UPI000444979D|nr:uncharacterized protein STEHIDRAFT_131718 [Stereum hirsutum FP-91666 SS1]EIM86068.1 hypothetical protein STEHIDRAFT_131718 [Stereum hirsutum FP-91666 SS1]